MSMTKKEEAIALITNRIFINHFKDSKGYIPREHIEKVVGETLEILRPHIEIKGGE